MEDWMVDILGIEPSIIFADDPVLPEQFFSNPQAKRGRPELVLMLAVFDDAFLCFQRGVYGTGANSQALRDQAEAWFKSKDELWPFSFENICLALGLEPDHVRQRLQKWEDQVRAGQIAVKNYHRRVASSRGLKAA